MSSGKARQHFQRQELQNGFRLDVTFDRVFGRVTQTWYIRERRRAQEEDT